MQGILDWIHASVKSASQEGRGRGEDIQAAIGFTRIGPPLGAMTLHHVSILVKMHREDGQQDEGLSYSATRKNMNSVGRVYEEKEESIYVLPLSFDGG